MPRRCETDEWGVPNKRKYHHRKIKERGAEELIGICKGIIADGAVNQDEAEFLMQWLDNHAHIANEWPASVIFPRVLSFLEDGVLDLNEKKNLFELLHKTVGGNTQFDMGYQAPSALPLNDPMPPVVFDCRNFVLTGEFAFGSRHDCEEEIKNFGGGVQKNVTKQTDYVVIGTMAALEWAHTTYGRKVEKAMDYRDNRGLPLAIISEEHWAEQFLIF